MKAFCENKEAEKVLDKMLQDWEVTLEALKGKKCFAHFLGGRLMGIETYYPGYAGEIKPNSVIVDLSDMSQAVRRLCMIQLYNHGFVGKDLRDFDIALETPTLAPVKCNTRYEGLEIAKCECGGEKANVGHSTWCPKYV